jgi:hypothetical protein
MKTAFDRVLRQAQWRCHINLLLAQWVRAMLVAGVIGIAAALGQKIFVVYQVQAWMAGALAGLAAVAAAGLYLIGRPSRMDAAVQIDQKLRLRERFSSALALQSVEDPFAQAACVEAHEAAQHVQIGGQFPIRLGRRWMPAMASWVAAAAILLFLPTLDVLGYYRQETARKEERLKQAEARAEVAKELEKVQMVVNKLGEKGLAGELAQMEKAAPDGMKADDLKRQALPKLEELASKLDKKNEIKLDTFKDLQDRLKTLRGSPEGLDQQLNRALAKGNMKKASEIVKDLQKKLDSGEMNSKDQEALAKQLQDLAKQLEDAAKGDKNLEQELAEKGLDKELAKLDPEKLREALKNQGLTQEQIDQLADAAAASQNAKQALSKLAQAMSKAGMAKGSGQMAQELDPLSDQLTEAEAMLQDMELTKAELDELKRCMGKLGCCGGEGEGENGCPGIGEWAEGDPMGQGGGTGGPGIGQGPRPIAEGGDVATERHKANVVTQDGPAIASTFIKDSQVKGESKKEFQNVVQAAKDAAAEAISENQIPRRYEGAIKGYFNQIDQEKKPK